MNEFDREFEEYFKGVKTPDNITGDAKAQVSPARRTLPKFVKLACVAASFALVFALTLTFIFRDRFAAPPASDAPSYYTAADLDTKYCSAYSLSDLDERLGFIQNLAVADNAFVSSVSAGYKGGRLALVKARVSVMHNLCRDEAEVFAEFTDEKEIYDRLKDYADGDKHTLRGVEYRLTRSVAENGEPQFRLYAERGGVKYYFDIRSNDKKAYEKYLKMIIK